MATMAQQFCEKYCEPTSPDDTLHWKFLGSLALAPSIQDVEDAGGKVLEFVPAEPSDYFDAKNDRYLVFSDCSMIEQLAPGRYWRRCIWSGTGMHGPIYNKLGLSYDQESGKTLDVNGNPVARV